MSPQLRMLLWKEWRERRTQFLVCLLWMAGGTACIVAFEWSREFRAPVDGFYNVAIMLAMFMPIFVAMRTSLGETTDRTRSFTSALPVSAHRRGWIRLAGGAAVLAAPILLAAILLSLYLALGWVEESPPQLARSALDVPLPNPGTENVLPQIAFLWARALVVILGATSLHVLLSLLGTAVRTEASAGFVGAVVAFLWFVGNVSVAFSAIAQPGEPRWIHAIAPLGILRTLDYGRERGWYGGDLWAYSGVLAPLLGNAIVQLAIAAWFVRRYSRRLPGRAAEAVRGVLPHVWRPWSFALPGRSIALMWLTLRQSVPMCLPGLLIACLATSLWSSGAAPWDGQFSLRFADSLPSNMWTVGFLWAVVVGAGMFSAEVDWRVGEFWRTRPIPFWGLFAAKFFVGLLAVLLVLDGTAVALSWNSPNWGTFSSMNWPYIACIAPQHAVMFAIAVAWTCVLRRPVLGGMAALVSFAMIVVAIQSSDATRHLHPNDVYVQLGNASARAGGEIDFTAHGYPVVAAAMGVVFLASILVGGLALQRYDPRRQSG